MTTRVPVLGYYSSRFRVVLLWRRDAYVFYRLPRVEGVVHA